MANDKETRNIDSSMSDLNLHDELPDLDDLDLDDLADDIDLGADKEHVSNISLLKSIPVDITVEVARKTLILDELLNLKAGSVVMLEKHEGDPVDIKINGTAFGTGEIVSKNGQYGVRLLSIIKKPSK
ncbi:Flagellar motor switch protein FliN [Vibrio chagasii]|jgi:flagellar motor switch protein FliN/FliY|uniref:Flagellar motor switch protein FliN n=1 Tax=Vibrio chagasii TaxID=170679 RepID=A0A7Y4DUB6_9VIBR|nr:MULTISPECIES: FliM/FliN family flagellar motor switch protein [Vibrio]EDK29593.1 flagellar motor switch protein [Vibrionales bacterium SWAT-3]MDE9381016.1 FliM/FliN family flagellar motor switch protein [Vibrio alginolyticus]KZX59830.1 flagellar motor switch protein FliN [Vibrio sp. HI00D65]MCG9560041.1 FliM/FliN family flagellar motor switch protein [Vibrio chagasii]MCG9567313.1 FliM/FliN family flagellar motor switch protein [Vibrio chagasii]